MQCTKCRTEAALGARYCTRCHTPLEYECPACHHHQAEGGRCEKCGTDFMKYLSSMIAVKRVQAEAEHDRRQKRNNFVKQLIYIPLTGGLSLLKDIFRSSRAS